MSKAYIRVLFNLDTYDSIMLSNFGDDRQYYCHWSTKKCMNSPVTLLCYTENNCAIALKMLFDLIRDTAFIQWYLERKLFYDLNYMRYKDIHF